MRLRSKVYPYTFCDKFPEGPWHTVYILTVLAETGTDVYHEQYPTHDEAMAARPEVMKCLRRQLKEGKVAPC
jgi:hypothetical protein